MPERSGLFTIQFIHYCLLMILLSQLNVFCRSLHIITNLTTARTWYSSVRERSFELVSGVIFVCLLL